MELAFQPTQRVERIFSEFEKLPEQKLRALLDEIFDQPLTSLNYEALKYMLFINLCEMESAGFLDEQGLIKLAHQYRA